ncbi:hypothetical protein [Sorangium cellulosum]|uniref:Orc1-like AAA ATPase domain-containing protein n=1 Tax=Sorangium cellulosum So0157-2 TaxID=1254432 RepID=S4XWV8_SORCE|nr:hypothetical protein [Sorangium cellulosum]AGP36380.1 hypothetical protein SCE1572_18915 [Sorangium cellulosum So0157-2]
MGMVPSGTFPAMEFERLQELYNRCNPDEPLSPGDERNVDIDVRGVRGAHWTNKLARQIELSRTPVCQLFTGLRGTGKSTEIQRLAARLSDPKRRNLLTVLIDADDVLDLTVEIDISDVLALVLLHAERAVLAAEGGDATSALTDGPHRRLWAWLSRTDVEIGKLTAGVEAGAKAGVELNLKTNPTVRHRVREIVARHLSTFVRFVHDEVRELDWRARKLGRSGIAILFDSLEKLRGTSLTWKPVLESAERIFSTGAPYLQLPVHVLYTVPPALARRMVEPPVAFLPMIKVRDIEGRLHPEGVEVITELVKRRIDDDALREIFGESALRDRLRAIALWSGGYPREIVRLLQTLLELETFPVDGETLERELRRAGNGYRSIVYDSGAIPWLAKVNRTKQLITSNEQEREAADHLLQNNVILRYLNDDEWVDLHPSVAGMQELAGPFPDAKDAAAEKGA